MEEINRETDAKPYAKLTRIFGVGFAFLFSVGLALPAAAEAASLYFYPSSGSYSIGQTFNVSLYVSSANQTMNACQGIINFSADKLQVTNISKSNSILTLWVKEPYYSNIDGTINFAGMVPNPGFTGNGGKILTITFKVRDSGDALFTLSKGSVLANDGLATQILVGGASADFTLTPAGQPAAPEIGGPSGPVISSPTHPNPEKWYNNPNPKFTWPITGDVSSARVLYSKYSDSQPNIIYTPAISEKQLENIADGIYYFHVQLKNKDGWGGVSHFRFQIDTKPPEPFLIKFVHGKEEIDPNPIITFNTTDVLSGIDYYRIKIGESDFLKLDPNLIISNPYALPPQAPGQRTVLAQAFDMAGNMAVAAEEFTILPIKTPTIIYYPKEVKEGDLLEIRGITYPDASVDIFLKKEGEEAIKQTTRSNSSGDFTLIWSPKITNGLYGMWAQVTDSRGAKSYESPSLTIVVKSSAIFQIGSFVISYLSLIFLLISISFALMIGCWYVWYKFTLFRKRLGKEVRETEETLHKAFDFLKEEVKQQIKVLEKASTKRQLTEDEEKLISRLRKDLDAAEKLVRKEIEDIRKELD